MKAIVRLKSFPNHQGIPGHQGGSLPMNASESYDNLYKYYAEQLAVDNTDYVDLFKVMDRFCKDTGLSNKAFESMLNKYFKQWLSSGKHIALEVDATPQRMAQINKRKFNKIMVNGNAMYVIAMRK